MITGARFRNRSETNLPKDPIEELVLYVKEMAASSKTLGYPLTAFNRKNQWYFRANLGLRTAVLEMVIDAGFVDEDREYFHLSSSYVSETNSRTPNKAKFYRIRTQKLNDLISRGQD